MSVRALVLLAVGLSALAADAQTDGLESAEAALADGHFTEARAAAEAAIAADDTDDEAYYLLGRVLYAEANPSRDERRAGRAVARALSLEPDNVVYLVARLESLRRDARTLFGDLLLAQERASLANRLLALDPDNGFAHEELGILAIRDYYQYRNAIALPGLVFAQPSRRAERAQAQVVTRLGTAEEDPFVEEVADMTADQFGQVLVAPGAVRSDDRFDVDALVEREGVGVVTYERRARAAYDQAIGHLRAALAQDARRRSVYDHVVRLSVLARDYASAFPFVREMLTQFDADPASWLYLGLLAHRTGDYDAASGAFDRALDRMTPADSAAYADLSPILPPDNLPAYRADPDGFARQYWTARDPRFLNSVNERRTEHYARLVEADLLYRSAQLDLPGWRTERGELYLRYGAPERDVILDGGFGNALGQFSDRNPAFAPGLADDPNRFNVWDYGDFRLVFEDPNRNGEFRLYSPPADVFALADADDAARMDYVMAARVQVRREPERYRFQAPGRAVDLPYRVVAFRGDAGRSDLYVVYGVPLATDTLASTGRDIDVTIRTGAFLVGPERDLLVERRRTIYGLRAAQVVRFDATRLWTSVEAMTARPGPHDVSLEFETASGQTSAVQRRPVVVPDFSAGGLQLSDVLLAYQSEPDEGDAAPGRIVRNGLSMQPAPWSVFGVSDAIHVYIEVYGLTLSAGRSDYEIEARLVPRDTRRGLARTFGRLFGGRARGVSTTAEAQGDAADDWQSATLDTSGQAPGVYTLTVVVRDRHTGRTATRETDLSLE